MPVTTTQLVAEIRTTSDLQASRFCTDPELLLMANEVLADLYDKLVSAREGYFQTSTPLTLVSNSSNLPEDFYKEIGLTGGTAPNLYNILPLESFNDRIFVDGLRYWIASRVITIYPITIAPVAPVTLTYVPNCPVLADAANIPVDLERFRRYIAVGASIIVKAKRNQPSTDLLRQMAILDARVTNMATGRKAGPKIVAMPASEQRGSWGYMTGRRHWGGY